MKSSFSVFFLFSFLLLVTVSSGMAHMDAGFDDVVDGYIIDLGYAPADPVAQNQTILNFNLVKNSTQEVVSFTSIFIRVSNSEGINVFTGTFKPSHDNVNFIYTFPKEGRYSISARFYNGTDVIVEHTNILDVSKNGKLLESDPDFIYVICTLAVMLIIIIALTISLRKSRRK